MVPERSPGASCSSKETMPSGGRSRCQLQTRWRSLCLEPRTGSWKVLRGGLEQSSPEQDDGSGRAENGLGKLDRASPSQLPAFLLTGV